MALVTIVATKVFGGSRRGTEIKVPGQSQSFVIDATVSAQHDDDAETTDHPVEEGVDITDHTVLKPKTLTLSCVHSDTPLNFGAQLVGFGQGALAAVARRTGGPFVAAAANVGAGLFTNLVRGGGSRTKNAYDYFLDLQAKRIPFTVVTGLRTYENMIITKIGVTRDAKSGRSLRFTVSFKQIRVVQNRIINVPNVAAGTDVSGRQKLGKKAGQELQGSRRSILKASFDKITGALGGLGG